MIPSFSLAVLRRLAFFVTMAAALSTTVFGSRGNPRRRLTGHGPGSILSYLGRTRLSPHLSKAPERGVSVPPSIVETAT